MSNNPYASIRQPEEPTDWRERAACIGMPTRMFYPEHAGERMEDARAICLICPVKIECRNEGRANNERGIWGDENDYERTRAKRTKRPVKRPSCGTRKGYDQHLHNGEITCEACRAVNRETNRRRRECQVTSYKPPPTDQLERVRIEVELRRDRVVQLSLEGMSVREIAETLHVADRTVVRDRRARGEIEI